MRPLLFIILVARYSNNYIKRTEEVQISQLEVTLRKEVLHIFKVCKNPADVVPRLGYNIFVPI